MPRAPKKCGRAGCDQRVIGRAYCDTHTAELQRRGNTTARGYGSTHQRERAKWAPLVAAGRVDCWRCGERINPRDGQWDLGHDDHDRSITRGPEHARRCNRAAAGRSRGPGTPSPPRSG